MSFLRQAFLAGIALSIVACSGGAAPAGSRTQPPAGATAAPGAPTPAGATGGGGAALCSLVTVEEMGQIFGETFTVTDSSDNSCTYTSTTSLTNASLRFEDTGLDTAHTLLGSTAADVTVAGNPGVIGNLMGVILYVRHGNQDLVVQTVLLNDTPDNRNKVVAVATKALSRIP